MAARRCIVIQELNHPSFLSHGRHHLLFSYLICLHTTTFILLSIFPLVEKISFKICERPLSWHAESVFNSGFRPWLKNRGCFSSLLAKRHRPANQRALKAKFICVVWVLVIWRCPKGLVTTKFKNLLGLHSGGKFFDPKK